jgi:hypothetical protein
VLAQVALAVLGQCVEIHAYCLCSPELPQPSWVAVGFIESSNGHTVLYPETVVGTVPSQLPAEGTPGDHVLLLSDGVQRNLTDDGGFQCADVTVDPVLYAHSLVEGGCVAALDNAGVTQPPCHDTERLCGCDSSGAPALLLALLLLYRPASRAFGRG